MPTAPSQHRLALSKALVYSQDPVMLDKNKIRGQKWKDNEVKQVKGKTSPSHRHKLLTEELSTQQDRRGTGEG